MQHQPPSSQSGSAFLIILLGTQFDFSNIVWKKIDGTYTFASGHNPNAVSGCSVLKVGEGNAAAAFFPSNYFVAGSYAASQSQPGSSSALAMVVPNVGTSAADLVYHLPHLTKNICLKINSLLGIPTRSNGDPPRATANPNLLLYDGVYSTNSFTDTDSAFTGKTAFCALTNTSTASYRYYKVFIVR